MIENHKRRGRPPKASSAPPEKPRSQFLRATKYDIVDPTSGVRIGKTETRVQSISRWLRAQINLGLVEIVEE